ncbi:MAG: hypothetical protein II362_03965, partial [Alistipes sp.]|nr:hypothetical protein [Alistipes sp.]
WAVWNPQTMQPISELGGKRTEVSFCSDRKGDKLSFPFEGSRVAVLGRSFQNGGYAEVRILDANGRIVYSNRIDFYSKVADNGLRFVGPQLSRGRYTLEVECAGEHPEWWDKRKNHYGSTEDWVQVNEIRVY